MSLLKMENGFETTSDSHARGMLPLVTASFVVLPRPKSVLSQRPVVNSEQYLARRERKVAQLVSSAVLFKGCLDSLDSGVLRD